jgi:hypothetical protein
MHRPMMSESTIDTRHTSAANGYERLYGLATICHEDTCTYVSSSAGKVQLILRTSCTYGRPEVKEKRLPRREMIELRSISRETRYPLNGPLSLT